MMAATEKRRGAGWLNLLVDYGPVLVFFLVYKLSSPGPDDDAIGEVRR
jgi:intracellular septation protein